MSVDSRVFLFDLFAVSLWVELVWFVSVAVALSFGVSNDRIDSKCKNMWRKTNLCAHWYRRFHRFSKNQPVDCDISGGILVDIRHTE